MNFPAFILRRLAKRKPRASIPDETWRILVKYERIQNGSRERLSLVPGGRAVKYLAERWAQYQQQRRTHEGHQ